MQKTINSTIFRKMIIASAKILDDNKNFVDSLNVFPVPDGDTGTNMSLTYNNVVKAPVIIALVILAKSFSKQLLSSFTTLL